MAVTPVRFGRPVLRVATALAITTLLSGCWFQVGFDGGRTRHNPTERVLTPATVGGLRVVWSASSGTSEAVVADGKVFVADAWGQAGWVDAYDLADGSMVWSTELVRMEGFNVDTYVAPVSVQGDHLATGYVGINTRTLECSAGTVEVDPDTGASTHDPDAQGFQSSSTATSNGVAARALQSIGDPPCTGASEPYFLDVSVDRPGVPATRWTTARTRSYVEPSVAGDQVFVSGSTTVAAFDATGCGASVCSPIWSREFSESSSLVAVATGPVHVSSASQVMALDRTTGTELWRVDLEGTVRGIARANGMIYATVERPGEASLLVAFPAGGCRAPTCAATRTWTLAGTDTSSPTVAGGVVYTSSGDALQAFDASGCGEATCPALVTVPDVAGGSVSVSNGHVLVSGLRTLTALALA